MKRQMTEEQVKEMVDRYLKGQTMSEIEKEMKINKGIVNYWLIRAGVYNNSDGRQSETIRKRNEQKKRCKSCAYGDPHGYCQYIVKTSKKRPCPVSECTFFKTVEIADTSNEDDTIVEYELDDVEQYYYTQAIIERY